MSYISWYELLEIRSLSYVWSSSSSFQIILQKVWLNLQKQINSFKNLCAFLEVFLMQLTKLVDHYKDILTFTIGLFLKF